MLRVVRAYVRFQVPFVLAVPRSLFLLSSQGMHAVGELPGVQTIDCDQRQFEARWRKPTVLFTYRVDDSHRLDKQCFPRRGICSFRKRPHLQAAGKAPAGAVWAPLSCAFPASLCRDIAHCLIDEAWAIHVPTWDRSLTDMADKGRPGRYGEHRW